jgi:translation initiation factor IF-3
VIDEEGKHLGILNTQEALTLAQERGFDLVEISPKEDPPVAKFLDFGQFKYELEKKRKAQKSKKIALKGIRLSFRIGKGDLAFKKEQAKKFLEAGHKVKIEMVLKGREKAHLGLAKEIINNFIQTLGEEISLGIEQPLTRQGGRLTVIVKAR